MHGLWEALHSYPPSIAALLMALAAPLVVLVGVVGTVVNKAASRRLAIAATVSPAVLTLGPPPIVALGARSTRASKSSWTHASRG